MQGQRDMMINSWDRRSVKHMPRLAWLFCALFIACLFTSCATATAESVAGKAPAKTSTKIIAVGDIHGDFDAYASILTAAGLVDDKMKWAGGKTIFVQTGDIPDRGPDTRKIITHLQTLQKQARRKGGAVITLVGNHEAMNMTGDLRYVDPGEYQAFVTKNSAKIRDLIYLDNQDVIETFYRAKDPELSPDAIRELWNDTSPLGKIEHQLAWEPKGEIGKWVVKNPAIVLVDGNLFAHGGVSQASAALGIDAVNAKVKAALKAQDGSLDSIVNASDGPLWHRRYAESAPAPAPASATLDTTEPSAAPSLTPEQELTAVLETLGAQRLIVGHTRSEDGIRTRYGGRLIQIDTGASKYYGGIRSFLRIENGKLFAHDNGTVRALGE